MKRKITLVTGTRGEYGLLRPLIRSILSSKRFRLFLIVTGMHLSKKHGMTVNEIKKDEIPIYATIKMLPQGNSGYHMSIAVGEGIIEFSKIFKKIRPDVNVVLGDRDEALAASIAAYHMNIPNAHIHGGDKSMAGIDEYNRHAITKISNIHFAATKKSMERIIKMGEHPKNVFLTGSPGIDEIFDDRITKKTDLEKKYGIKFSGKEIILLQHPVTTQIKETQRQIDSTLRAIAKAKKPVIAISPNSDAGNEVIFKKISEFATKYTNVRVYRSVPREDFLALLRYCGVLVGNSSSGMIEAGYFGIPVVNIGIRQKDREGIPTIIHVNNSTAAIYSALIKAFNSRKKTSAKTIYGNGNAAKKIMCVLENIKLNDKLIQKQITY